MIAFILMLSLYFFIDPSTTAFFPKCPFLSLTGIYCPGCGSQRAIHHILQGHILTGIRHNYMFLLVIVVLSYQAIIFIINKLGKKTYNNLLHKSKTTYTILVLVILFWIMRNIPYFPFMELAP